MYNIIDSKYRGIFLICILGILLFLFINSGAVVEGYKKINIKKQINSDLRKTVKAEVNAQLPSLISGVLAKEVENIKVTQAKISDNLTQLSSKQEELKKINENTLTRMRNNFKYYNSIFKNSGKEFSRNLSQQYEMHKNGLANEGSSATNSITQLNKTTLTASEEAAAAAKEARESADSTKKIYEDVFGKLSADIIRRDNATFSNNQPSTTVQAFTQMKESGYKNLFDLEKDLVNKINDFNTSYYNFIRCSSGSVNCGTTYTAKNVEEKSILVKNAVEALQAAYNNAEIDTNETDFKANHQKIMDKSKTIDELRRNLDVKMDAIIKSKNPPNELTKQYDSTVYTGIMWSVLATSVLFYIFTEL